MNPEQLAKLSKLVQSLKAKVKCSICLDYIENTAELECSHRFCNNCLIELRSQSSKCPLCSQPIGRRAPVYRDNFVNELSKFTNVICQLIKEKYAHEVDELCSKKMSLQEIINTAPQDTHTLAGTSRVVKLNSTQHDNAVDELKTNFVQCNVTKKKEVEQPKVRNFEDDDARTKIINWLNDNQNNLNRLTQTQSPQLSEDASELLIPSISQVPPTRIRSQSLTVDDGLPGPLLRRYHSLTEGLNDDDYNIEEVHSETLVKQVERRVLQDMLEDECLANLEQVAQLDNEEPKATSSKSKQKSALVETRNANLNEPGCSAGWNRIKEVKKTIDGVVKKPKKLNIKLQSTNANTKTSPKGISEKKGSKGKSPPKIGKTLDDKEKGDPSKKQCAIKDDLNSSARQTFNLSLVENYFDQHMEGINICPENNTSSDMEIHIPAVTAKDDKNKQNVGATDKNGELSIFCAPTQITPHSANQHNAICRISPIPKDFNDLDHVAVRLSDNLQSCISSAANLQNNLNHQLVECFTNLLTYAERMIQLGSLKGNSTAIATQTVHVGTKAVAVQTESSPSYTLLSRHVQTSPRLRNVEAQTEVLVGVERGIQTVPEISVSSSTTNLAKMPKPIKSSDQSSEESEIMCVKKFRNSKGNVSFGISKENKSSKASNASSQSSILICTLDPSTKSANKVNRKLSFEDSQNRKFKRIRIPTSDSESEDGNPSKRKFIRDDLTVEFADTERPEKTSNNDPKDFSTSESEKMDYDKYLLEVMDKYEPSPPSKKAIARVRTTPKNTSTAHDRSPREKHQKLQKVSLTGQPERKSDRDVASGDHVFTASVAFQENLDKFDKEILEFERTTKTYNTEFDLVENTPLVSPKRNKIPRLSSKKPDKIQIISKGSVGNPSNKPENVAPGDGFTSETTDLDRNIGHISSQIEKCPEDDVADILKDIRDNEDFFKTNLECDEKQRCADISAQSLSKRVNMVDQADTDKTNVNFSHKENINITQVNINEIIENLDDFGDDDEIEEELQKISFPVAQKEASKSNKINILQNLKLRSRDNRDGDVELGGVTENSDLSDEEIVENTPQKKRNSRDRSVLIDSVEELASFMDANNLCLPPPPGFGDGDEPNLSLEILKENSESHKENNYCPLRENKSSVTPDRLSDFIFTPDDKPLDTEKEVSQQSLTFKTSVVTPRRGVKQKIARVSQAAIIVDNSEGVFSPITNKSSVRLSEAKYTPLVATSRSTKKPKLMTSTPNQKSILNYVVPSQESSPVIAPNLKPCIMWSRILNRDLNIFTQLECRKLLTTAKVFSPQVTHLIVLVDERGQIFSHTAKILQAIAAGIWVVRYEWADDCLKMNRIVSEEPYEALDTTGVAGPQISRLSRNSKPLFEGFKFYCAPPLKTVPKDDLESILQLAGGEVAKDLVALLENDGKVHIILTESSATEETEQFDTWLEVYKAVTVDVEWLTCCIGQFKIVSFRPFLVSADESRIGDLRYPPTLVETVPLTLTETA